MEPPTERGRCYKHQEFGEDTVLQFYGWSGPGTITAKALGFIDPDKDDDMTDDDNALQPEE